VSALLDTASVQGVEMRLCAERCPGGTSPGRVQVNTAIVRRGRDRGVKFGGEENSVFAQQPHHAPLAERVSVVGALRVSIRPL